MSPLFVLLVTVVLLFASGPVHPALAIALPLTLRHDLNAPTSRHGRRLFGSNFATRTGPDGPPKSSRDARAVGYRDPLAPYRATVGLEALTPWYIRVRAIILLLLIVAAIGASIAGATLLLIASGRFVLELLAG